MTPLDVLKKTRDFFKKYPHRWIKYSDNRIVITKNKKDKLIQEQGYCLQGKLQHSAEMYTPYDKTYAQKVILYDIARDIFADANSLPLKDIVRFNDKGTTKVEDVIKALDKAIEYVNQKKRTRKTNK